MKSDTLPIQQLEPMDKPTLSYWKKEVTASIERQRIEFIERVKFNLLIEYLEGLQGKDTWTIVDEFSPAIISVVSSVYYQNPTVTTEAGNPEADGMVQPSLMYLLQHPDFRPFKLTDLLRGSLTYGMKKSGMKLEMQISCFDLMLAGYACVEMNVTTADEAVPTVDGKPQSDVRQNPIMDAIGDGVQSLIGMVTGKSPESKSEDEVATDVVSTTQKDIRTDSTDQTYCKRWNPLDILFDPRAQVFNESRWIGKKIRMSLAEFNAKYPKFKGQVPVGDKNLGDMSYSQHEREENRKCVVLYEIEIKKKGPRNCILVMHPSLNESLDYYERPIISNDFAVKYGCIDKYGKIYPMSRGKKAKRSQDDINHYMTIQFEHVDRAQRKVAVYVDGLTESGKAAQRSSDVYAIVDKKTPQAVYEVMPAPSVVPENKEIVAKSIDTLNKQIGTTELAKSGESQNDTLGQDELQTQAFQVNVNAVQDALGDLAQELLDELKDIVLQTWDGQDYFKVTGIRGGDAWYTPEMGPLADLLIGDYGVNVNIASAARPNPLKDRQDFMTYAQIVTSPPMIQFALMHHKQPSMEVLNSLAKKFDQNPDMIYEDALPPALIGPDGQPLQPQSPPSPNPEAKLVQPEGSRFDNGAVQAQGVPSGSNLSI